MLDDDDDDVEEEERDNLVADVEVVEEEEGPEMVGGGGGGGPGRVGGERILRQRVSIGRFNSLLVTTLLSPFLAALGGAGLLYLANKEGKSALVLSKILGLSSSSSSSSRSPSSIIIIPTTHASLSTSLTTLQKIISSDLVTSTLGSLSLGLSSLTWLKSFTSLPTTTTTTRGINSLTSLTSLTSSSSVISSGIVVDPIWIRNSLGLGIILLIRDCFELIIGELEDNRKKSRKIISRDFNEGLEL